MDNQLSSSGKFSQVKNHRRFCRRSRIIYEAGTLNLTILKDQIIFMSMFNDLDWTRKGYEEKCILNFEDVKIYAKRFSQGHWKFLVPEDEKKCYGIWKP